MPDIANINNNKVHVYVSALFTLQSYFLYTAYVHREEVDETPGIDAYMELVDETPDHDANIEEYCMYAIFIINTRDDILLVVANILRSCMTADTVIISFLQLVSLTCTSLPSLLRGRMMGLKIKSHILSRWQLLDSKLKQSHCPI